MQFVPVAADLQDLAGFSVRDINRNPNYNVFRDGLFNLDDDSLDVQNLYGPGYFNKTPKTVRTQYISPAYRKVVKPKSVTISAIGLDEEDSDLQALYGPGYFNQTPKRYSSSYVIPGYQKVRVPQPKTYTQTARL